MKRESSTSYDSKFNICIVGSPKIGKTSYIMRIIDDKFLATYNKTCGINTHTYKKELNKACYLFKFWDLSGETKPILSNEFYRSIDCFIFAFAQNDKNSFNNVKEWMDYVMSKKISLYHSLLLCLKSDTHLENNSEETNINSTVEESEVKRISLDYEIDYINVSSKDNYNIKESLEILLNKMLMKLGNDGANLLNAEEHMSNSGCLIF
jgi:GTPase SAR1 family protein